MMPVLFSSGETAFTSNGIGKLSDAATCVAMEELNGAFELELTYPADGLHAAEIAEGAILLSPYDESGDMQPFRIYKRTDTLDGVFTALARHISGDLTRIPVMPFTAATPAAALSGIKNNAAVACPFTFSTDKTNSGAFAVEVPVSAKAALGGGEGSVIGVFGGEVK